MPIRPATLEKYSEKYVILVDGSQLLHDAIERFHESLYLENSAYLVVANPYDQYQVILFSELKGILQKLGPNSLNIPLFRLPIPLVSQVISANTLESGRKVIEWVTSHPTSRVVVINEQGFVGLFANPNRSDGGVVGRLSWQEIYGKITTSSESTNDLSVAEYSFSKVEFHTKVKFPGQLKPDDEKPLVVQLTVDNAQDTQADATVEIEYSQIYSPEQIDIVVIAPDFSERTNRWSQTILVYSFADSQPAVFMLKAGSEQGSRLITIDFYHKGRSVGCAQFQVEITQTITNLDRSITLRRLLPTIRGLSQNPVPPADVELRIVKAEDENTLSFTLHSSLARVGYHYTRVGTKKLTTGNPRQYLEKIFQELNAWASNQEIELSAANAQQIIQQLEAIGENIFLELFPEELQREYWKLKILREQGVIRSLLITSDEPWIPWELAKPFNNENGEQDDYLAASFHISRWLAGLGPADEVRICSACLVAPELDLAFVYRERDFFEQLRNRGIQVSEYLRSKRDIQKIAKEGKIELLHLATHGGFKAENPEESPIVLQDGEELYPRDLKGSRVWGLRQSRPVVFLNTCDSAQISFSLTGLGGWAETLINDVHVSAFIGGLWQVNDELAAIFAQRFYENLWVGLTLGESFHDARLHIRQLRPANSTWLAYTLYGDPNTRVFWGS